MELEELKAVDGPSDRLDVWWHCDSSEIFIIRPTTRRAKFVSWVKRILGIKSPTEEQLCKSAISTDGKKPVVILTPKGLVGTFGDRRSALPHFNHETEELCEVTHEQDRRAHTGPTN